MHKKIFTILLVVIFLVIITVVAIILFKISDKGKDKIALPNFIRSKMNTAQEEKFIAIGASIAKANNLSLSLIGDNPDYSFATGTKIESIFLYLTNQGKNLTPINLAESGANSQSVLEKQVPNVITYQPQYVTIDATSDILENATPTELIKNLSKIITKIKTEDTIILIGSYPNFPKAREAQYPACKEDKLQVGFDKLTQDKILSFNQALKNFANQNNLVYVDIYNVLEPSDISDYDCIHPNIEGQKKLAKVWIEALKERR